MQGLATAQIVSDVTLGGAAEKRTPIEGVPSYLVGVEDAAEIVCAGTEARALPVPPPGPKLIAAETMPPDPHQLAIAHEPVDDDPVFQSSSGGDFMVDVLKTLDIDYLAVTCGSTFRGLHEAVVNYGNNTKPEVITGNHEEIGVAMAHGYAKMEGKPMVDVSRRTCFTTNARAISRVTSTTPFDPLTNFG